MVRRTAGPVLVRCRLTTASRLEQVRNILQSPSKGPVQAAAAFRICPARHTVIHVFRSPRDPILRTFRPRRGSSCVHRKDWVRPRD